jgi:DNA-directed RNA polymerase subunit RPC12/RpoP
VEDPLSLKQKTRPPVREDDARQHVDVSQSPVRCPYCHDSCTAETAGAIVCQVCLSRHHGACWREATSCASCGSKRALKGGPPEVTVSPADVKLLRRGLSREAVERVARRCEVDEAHATRVLLEAAAHELEQAAGKAIFPAWAVVAIAAILIPIVAILANS